MENALEPEHIGFVHPDSLGRLGLAQGENQFYGVNSVWTAPVGQDFHLDIQPLDPGRANLRRHLAFAQGPHTCLGIHLARLEARAAVTALLKLPGLRHDAARSTPPEGLVFRKPAAVWGTWTI